MRKSHIISSAIANHRKPSAYQKALIKKITRSMVCLGFSNLSCWAYTPLNPSTVLEFKISKSGLTRISIDNDAIEDVYAYPAEPDLIAHHKSGHVFVTPDGLDSPIYLTVITRKGTVQDLRLAPVSKKAEPVLLKAEEGKNSYPEAPSSDAERTYTHLLKQFLQGKVPPDFHEAISQEVSRGTGSFESVLDKAYQNGSFRVLAFTVRNASTEQHTLDHQEFWGKEDLASAFDRSTLGPNEETKLFVIQKL